MKSTSTQKLSSLGASITILVKLMFSMKDFDDQTNGVNEDNLGFKINEQRSAQSSLVLSNKPNLLHDV